MNTIRKLSLGSTISKRNTSTGELWTFGYDNDNRMLTAKDVSGAGATLTLATYTYDVFGNRIESDVWTQSSGTTTVTRFGYDGDQVWADLASNNSLQMRYLRGDEADQLFARISGAGVAAWYLTDWEGSVRNLTDGSANLTDTIAYGGFGDIQSESNTAAGGAYKFDGMRYDAETGFYHTDTRVDAPTDGRWLQQDPLGFRGGDQNLYRFVESNPAGLLDPTGLEAATAKGKGFTTSCNVEAFTDRLVLRMGKVKLMDLYGRGAPAAGSRTFNVNFLGALSIRINGKVEPLKWALESGVNMDADAKFKDAATASKYYWHQDMRVLVSDARGRAIENYPLQSDGDEHYGNQNTAGADVIARDGPSYGQSDSMLPQYIQGNREQGTITVFTVNQADYEKIRDQVDDFYGEHGYLANYTFYTKLKCKDPNSDDGTVVGYWFWGFVLAWHKTGEHYRPVVKVLGPRWHDAAK